MKVAKAKDGVIHYLLLDDGNPIFSGGIADLFRSECGEDIEVKPGEIYPEGTEDTDVTCPKCLKLK